MRILHVIPQLALGGAEQVVLGLVRRQRDLGVDARLVVLGSQNVFPERLAGLPEPLFLHYGGRRRDAGGFLRCVRRLRTHIRQQEADIVHSHLWPASRVAAWVVRGSTVPHVVHVHDTRPWLAEAGLRSSLLRVWTRRSLRSGHTSFIAVSHAAQRYTLEHLPGLTDSIEVCHNGINTDSFADDVSDATATEPSSERDRGGRRVIGTAGRFAPEKGHAHLIQTVAALRERGVDCTLRIAGEGGLRRDYERLIARLALDDLVELPGKVADMPGFYRGLDLFALPSTAAEGLPITLLEAMASRLPVVASDVGGVSEALRDGTDGRLVPPGDESALTEALLGMASDGPLRRRMGAAARRRVADCFSVDAMADHCVRLYERTAPPPHEAATGATAPDPRYG